MGSIGIELLVILILVMINGFFALAEIAIVSARQSRLRQQAAEGKRQAKVAIALLQDPSTFLSSVQVGITLVGIISGAFGGATLAEKLADSFEKLPWLAPYAETAGLAIVVMLILFLSVVLGELVPKQLAMSHPEKFAMLVSVPMQIIANAASPIVRLLGGSSRIVLNSLGIRATKETAVTDEEITFMVEEGVQSGTFERTESEIVARALRLDDRDIEALMTPRVDMVYLDTLSSAEEISNALRESSFTAYPVCTGSVDQIIGVVYASDAYSQILDNKHPLDPKIIHLPLIIPAGTRILKTVDLLSENREHIAIIKNEYGETEGLITRSDVFHSLVGVTISTGELAIVRRDDGSWLISGSLPVDELQDVLHKDILPEKGRSYYHTLAGFILDRLGRIPTVGDSFDWQSYRFEIVDMDGSRIDRVLVQRLSE